MMQYPIPPRNNFGQDITAYWEGFLTNEEINWILARPEWINNERAGVGGQTGSPAIIDNIRRSNVGWLTLTPETQWLWEKITQVIAEMNRRFFKFDLTGCYEPMQLGVYKDTDQGHYNWHTDAGMDDAAAPRKLSMSILLSDPSEFEGGEFQVKTFSDEPITLETKKGRAWFFPSYCLHRVAPVTRGVRRSLVLWVGGPPFK